MKFYSNNLYNGSPILGEGPIMSYGDCGYSGYGDIRTASLERDLRSTQVPRPPPEEKKTGAGTWIVLGLLGAGALVGGYFIFR